MGKLMQSFLFLSLLVIVPFYYNASAENTVVITQDAKFLKCESTNSCFIPIEISINEGEGIIWKNGDSVIHSIISGSPDNTTNLFNGTIDPGQNYTHAFEESGKFPYFCAIFPWMKGIVIVNETSPDNYQQNIVESFDMSDKLEFSHIKTFVPKETGKSPHEINSNFSKSVDFQNIIINPGNQSKVCQIDRSCFEPYSIWIMRGNGINWINMDSVEHAIKFHDEQKIIYSGLISPGENFQYVFANSGVYEFYSDIHPDMTGRIIVSKNLPSMTLEDLNLSVYADGLNFEPDDIVQIVAKFSSPISEQVGLVISDPSGTPIISRIITTDSFGKANLEFKLSEDARDGIYNIHASAQNNRKKILGNTSFMVGSTDSTISILSINVTDQHGNEMESFSKNNLGFVKLILNAENERFVLVTVNLFDNENHSVGLSSFKTNLPLGDSEVMLSFFIPQKTSSGSANAFVGVFSDWPSHGGVPLIPEIKTKIIIE